MQTMDKFNIVYAGDDNQVYSTYETSDEAHEIADRLSNCGIHCYVEKV